MYLKDIDTSLQIRAVYDDSPVKTAGTQQRLIEHLRSVRRRKYEKPLRRIKSIHLRKQLIQRLLTLIITSAVAAVTALSDRINLIDKDDARRIFLRLLKQVTHTRCSDTDEHLHKI